MADVYSTSIAQVQGLNGSIDVLVPAGSVFVVRDMWAYWNSATELFAKLYAIGDYGQTFWFALWTAIDANPIAYWQGRTVLNTRLTLRTDNPVDVTVSGYVLSLP